MEEMEFKVLTLEVGALDFNKDELKKQISENSQKYKNLVMSTEDDYKEFKLIRANLNKVAQIIDGERKRIKNEYTAPLKTFEENVKDCVEELNEAIKNVDNQIKAYEETIRKEKEELVIKLITDKGLLPYKSLIWNSSWLNQTVTAKNIEKDLDDIKSKISNDKLAIQEFTDNKTEQAEIEFEYNKTLDFAQSIRIWRERKKAVGEVAPESTPVEEEGGDIFSITFKVTGSKSKLMALSKFLKSNNYQYEKLGQSKEEK